MPQRLRGEHIFRARRESINYSVVSLYSRSPNCKIGARQLGGINNPIFSLEFTIGCCFSDYVFRSTHVEVLVGTIIMGPVLIVRVAKFSVREASIC